MSAAKSLGQIAYEAHRKAGLAVDSVDSWTDSSLFVQSTYERMAKVVAQEVERRRKAKEKPS